MKRCKDLAASFRGKPCVVCKSTVGTHGDHIKTIGSGGDDHPDNMWPLCFAHHRQKEDIALPEFVNTYPWLQKELEKRGFEYFDFSNKWVRLTKAGWDD